LFYYKHNVLLLLRKQQIHKGKNMKLYEIESKIQEVIEQGFSVDEETGELFESSDLEALEIDKAKKCLNIGRFVKNLLGELSMVEIERKALQAREKSLKNKVDSLKSYLEVYAYDQSFLDGTVKIKFAKQADELVIKKDLSEIPDLFIRIKPEVREVNKIELKKFLKDGNSVEYAELVERQKKVTIK